MRRRYRGRNRQGFSIADFDCDPDADPDRFWFKLFSKQPSAAAVDPGIQLI
jgi:hypothetical protein